MIPLIKLGALFIKPALIALAIFTGIGSLALVKANYDHSKRMEGQTEIALEQAVKQGLKWKKDAQVKAIESRKLSKHIAVTEAKYQKTMQLIDKWDQENETALDCVLPIDKYVELCEEGGCSPDSLRLSHTGNGVGNTSIGTTVNGE